MPLTTILGVDCATVATKTGLARAVLENGRWHLRDALIGTKDAPPAQVLAGWIDEDPAALLALDAPLGWPIDLGDALVGHRAGDPITAPSERLFARATDHAVHARLGYKVPGTAARAAVVQGWPDAVALPPSLDLVALEADAFDAIACVLAGVDFAQGAARGPDDLELAKREGWIWVRG